jgi:hypothetical protein
LQAILLALPEQAHTSAHVLESYHVLELAKRDAAGLRAEPTLAERTLLGNYLRLYQRLAERVRLIEWMVMPFVVRFDAGDLFLTQLVARLIDECAAPIRPPLVGGLSTNYYWTFPLYSVIGVPAGEVHALLGLPDLCHELGHILLDRHEAALLGDFAVKLGAHVQAEEARLVAAQRPPAYVASYVDHFRQWIDDWLFEFVSDMVGAYIAGPAYGLQHVRLCASLAGSVYYPTLGEAAEHPADGARLDGVVATLNELGDVGGAHTVSSWWRDYVAISGESEPGEYSMCYPKALVDDLAKTVVAGCSALGIRSYLSVGDGTLVQTFLSAWERFRADPDNYPEYERGQVRVLQKELGV